VELKRVADALTAFALNVPVIEKEAGIETLSGMRMSINRFPVAEARLLTKPKFVGGLFDVGEFVPLSMHCPTPPQ